MVKLEEVNRWQQMIDSNRGYIAVYSLITSLLVSECFVRPNNCNAQDSAMEQPFHLGPLDYSLLSLFNIQNGLLFSNNKPLCLDSLLDKLKKSLSIALIHFYPLAGRFVTRRHEEKRSCSIYVDCGKGPGARLIHAVARTVLVTDIIGVDPEISTLILYEDESIAILHKFEFLSRNQLSRRLKLIVVKPCQVIPSIDVPSVVGSFFDLGERATNQDGHTKPLLSIQVTELGDGIFIGFSMNHCVCDGTSFVHFMNMLSEISVKLDGNYSSISLSHIPTYKRPIPDGYDPIIHLPYLQPSEFLIPYQEVIQLKKRFFHISAASIAMLKTKVNSEEGRRSNCSDNTDTQEISSLQALSALLWRSITRSRRLPSDTSTTCALVADLRPRFDPPLSHNYFGCYITAAKATVKVGELLSHDMGWAAKLLHQAVIALDEKLSHDLYLDPLINGPRFRLPNLGSCGPNPVLIGGSPRFDLYGLEFGLGKAIAVRGGFVDRADGWIRANPGCEGGGSVDLDICLQHDTMTALLSDAELLQFVF